MGTEANGKVGRLAMDETAEARRVAAVLVNWNGFTDLAAALESLRRATPAPGLVVVVDNASRDGSPSRLAEWAAQHGVKQLTLGAREAAGACGAAPPWPDGLVLVVAGRNLGFAGGVNLGIRTARAVADPAYVLLLNNDATVASDFLPPLLGELAEPQVGAATGVIEYAGRPGENWYAGGRVDLIRGLGVHDNSQRALAPRDIEFVTGCFVLFRAEVFDRVGLLPELYFLYTEDLEFSLRLRHAGYRLRFTPASVAYHKVAATAGLWWESPAVAYLHNRNRLWFVRRNVAGPRRALALAWLVTTRLVHSAAETVKGRPRIAGQILRGTLDGVFRTPAADEGLAARVAGSC